MKGKAMKYLAFDIEIAKEIPEDAPDWKQYRPLGITCAATFVAGEHPRLWYSMKDGHYAPAMLQDDVADLVGYLRYMTMRGYTILTWNGLAFDFDVLAEESGLYSVCADLAMQHVDMMYHIFCLRGHYLGLDKVAKGLKLSGKTEGMTGAKAPQMWAEGQQAKVLEYVAQDVRTTLEVAREAQRLGMVQWTSASGRRNIIDIDRWLPVAEAQLLPYPDTSWMSNPVSRDQFTAWMHA
jgi:RNase_H superfamily